MSASRGEQEIICSFALQHIVNHGAQIVKDNKTVRKHMFNYANKANISVTNELVLHAGENGQSEPMP